MDELLKDIEERKTYNNNFLCEECNKKFSSKQCLKEHRYKHSNIKPYNCNLCKKKFRHASQLALHKKLHRERQDYYWPVLAEMEKKQVWYYFVNYQVVEKITVPLIGRTQDQTLPDFFSVLDRLGLES